MSDRAVVEQAVRAAVDAVAEGPSRAAFAALAELAQLDTNDVVCDLMVTIEDHADRAVRPTELLPDPAVTGELVAAVVANDGPQLRKLIRGDEADLVTCLVAVAAAQKPAPE